MNTHTTTRLYSTREEVYYQNEKGIFLIISPAIYSLDDICKVNNLPLDARPVSPEEEENCVYPQLSFEDLHYCDIFGDTI
jgi:hypothetical protein